MATESSIEIQKLKDCRQQNEHYWRIIEKQKAMIQNLQTSLAQLTDSYEVLYQRKKDTDVPDFDSLHVTHQIVEILEQESKELVQHKVPDQLTLGPVPPPRSPYRINQGLLPHTNIPDTSTPENNRVGQPSQNTSDYHKRPPALHLSISNHSNKNKHINQEVLLSPHRTQSAFSPLSPDSFSSGSDYTVSRSFNEHYTKTGEDITTLSLSSPTYLPSYHNNTQLYPLTPTRTIFDRNEHSQSNPSIINLKYLKPSLSEPNTPIKGRTPRYDSLTTNSVPNSCHMTSFDTSANRRRLLAEIKDVTVKFIHSVAMNEDPTIVLSVRRRISPQQKELWCIEKRWSELNTLDYNMRRNHCTMTEYKVFPDKILFASQTSSKLDQRKYVVEAYFKYLISIKPLNPAYLIDFLDSGVINKKKKERMTPQETVYEGHLSQLDTGCNINRYYVLESNGLLKYSDHTALLLALFICLTPK
ncbi:hypothetical protein BDB01DRAFT_490882 [Pilobolus umbonatus]|nr:hypothetical protein BDB01DRAFT_490882 [Pilobolus umbonatus]